MTRTVGIALVAIDGLYVAHQKVDHSYYQYGNEKQNFRASVALRWKKEVTASCVPEYQIAICELLRTNPELHLPFVDRKIIITLPVTMY